MKCDVGNTLTSGVQIKNVVLLVYKKGVKLAMIHWESLGKSSQHINMYGSGRSLLKTNSMAMRNKDIMESVGACFNSPETSVASLALELFYPA